MKNNILTITPKLNSVLFVLLMVLFNACTDPEKQGAAETTVEEDKVNIQQTFDDVLQCVENFKNGNSIDVIFRDFLNLSNGEPLNDLWLEELTSDLSSVINLDDIENNQRFDISFYAATYTYNIANSSWSKTLDQSNRVVFEFPSKPTATENNAELVLENFVDAGVTIDSETIYLPVSFDMIFDVDGARVTEINLNNVQYASNADFEIPVVLDLSIFMDPLTMTFAVSRNSTTSFNLLFTATDDDACDISLAGSLELDHDDYENLKETDIKKVTFELKLNKLKVQSLSGIAEFIKSEDRTENDFNTLIDLEVLFEDVKIGDLEWDETNDAFIIVYKDGTKEDSAIYHDGFFDDLADLWVEFFG